MSLDKRFRSTGCADGRHEDFQGVIKIILRATSAVLANANYRCNIMGLFMTGDEVPERLCGDIVVALLLGFSAPLIPGTCGATSKKSGPLHRGKHAACTSSEMLGRYTDFSVL
jgi:hypothetical protein